MGLFTSRKEVDPVEVDPVEVDPVEVDPVEVDPVEVDPVEVDPVEVDPVEVDPVEVDPLTTTQKKLHSALVAIDGRLANPEDLPFNADHLESEEALETAITDFLKSHPTLKKNYVAGDVGQGTRGSDKKPMDLIELMRMA